MPTGARIAPSAWTSTHEAHRSLAAGLAEIRAQSTRWLALMRLIAAVLFTGLGAVESFALDLADWQAALPLFAVYLAASVGLFLCLRAPRLRWLCGAASPFFDVLFVYAVQRAGLFLSPFPAGVAGWTLGPMVLVVLLGSLTLRGLAVYAVAAEAFACMVLLQSDVGVGAGAIVASGLILGVAAAVTNWGTQRIEALVERLGLLSGERTGAVERAELLWRQIGHSSSALSAAAGDLSGLGDLMDKNAAHTLEEAQALTSASELVTTSVRSMAAGTEELGASIREIARSAGTAARVASDAVGIASEANATVAALGESSRKIGAVLEVISGVAEQTNLLALNATIEAARAGPAGRGFAVVAMEVKELAKATARSVDDIGRMIGLVQADAGKAVDAIRRIGGIIHEVSGHQESIAVTVEQQATSSRGMAADAGRAAEVIARIAATASDVAAAAQSTTDGVRQARQSASGLQELARHLASLTAQAPSAA